MAHSIEHPPNGLLCFRLLDQQLNLRVAVEWRPRRMFVSRDQEMGELLIFQDLKAGILCKVALSSL